ncbi:MAG: rhodanese-like domain-containing protein [Elusimicrobiales bacterium]|nr:rhodanese-like domain-containing protein [Elusimicrobiales bacterium]
MHSRMMAVAVLFAGAYATAMPCRAEITQITAADLDAAVSAGADSVAVVDVRGAKDFAGKHIVGAVNAPYHAIAGAGLPKDRTIVLYCGEKCPLSHLAAKDLEKAGYTNVKVLAGGLDEWERGGFAVEAGGLVRPAKRAAKSGSVTASALKKKLSVGGIVVIDTRPEQEFLAGRVPGARNMPLEKLKDSMGKLPAGSELVVYDRNNARAVRAVRLLAEEGFAVSELSGGLQVWTAGKYPLETGAVK